jgi:D-amino-acid dehydrogenase
MNIIILGAGVIGVTTAYFLNRAGHEVIVIDQATAAGLGASFANGGQLSYSYTDALANPAILPQLPKLLLGREPAFHLKLSFDPALWNWGRQFLHNCTKVRATFNTTNVLRLALYSRSIVHQLVTEQQIEFDYRRNGKLHIYANAQDLQKAVDTMALKNQWGCQQQLLSATECLVKEPALRQLAGKIVGGIFSPLDEAGDSYKFTLALAKLCEASKNTVQFRYDTVVNRLVVENGRIAEVQTNTGKVRGDAVVLCLGAESALIGHTIGLKLPIYPLKGYSLTVPATAAAPVVNITDAQRKVVYCRLGDKLRIAGTVELGGYKATMNELQVQNIIKAAKDSFPAAGDYQQITRWVGLRPATPDSVPLLGRTPYPNLYLNTGHGMLGWTLACGSAVVVSDIINQIKPAIDLRGLTMERF